MPDFDLNKKIGSKVILMFSRGKDAVATALYLKEKGIEFVPVFLYLVPGLSFVEDTLDYYENFFGCKIIRLPHPSFYKWINDGLYQPSYRIKGIDKMDLPRFDYIDIYTAVKEDYNLPMNTYACLGVKSSDGQIRRLTITKNGFVNENKKTIYPIHFMKDVDVIDIIKRHNCKLAIDYRYMDSSFDGLKYKWLRPIFDHLPNDFKIIENYFPDCRAIINQVKMFHNGL